MAVFHDTYILAVDQGTSGTTAALFDVQGRLVASEDAPVKFYYPASGYVEQAPYELLGSIKSAFRGLALKTGIQPGQIIAMGLANQGESCLFWERETGEPLSPVIVWRDGRGAAFCNQMAAHARAEALLKNCTGLPLSPEWPAMKIDWARRQEGRLKECLMQGRAVLSSLDAWFIYQLSHGAVCVTDASTASRTGLFNIHTQQWDEQLLDLFDARGIILPEVVDNSGEMAMTEMGEGWQIPLTGGSLDQSAALLGQACTAPGEMKITYGTCVGFWYNLGQMAVEFPSLATSIAWRVNGQPTYAAAGEVGAAGAAIGWLRTQLKAGWNDRHISIITSTARPQDDLLFIPAFNGLEAPHWVHEARGTLFGVNASTSLEHLLFAALQSIAFTTNDMVQSMAADGRALVPQQVVVDGGVANNAYLMQFQADILGRAVVKPKNLEGTSRGIAYLAGVATGYYPAFEHARQNWEVAAMYGPKMGAAEREQRRQKWQNAVERAVQYYLDPRAKS